MPEVSLVLVYNSEGKLLLGKRKDSGKYTIPGGHQEEGESPEDCARRETREEAGIELMSLSFVKQQINEDGVTLNVFSGYASGNPKPHNKLDPDDEVKDEDWRWVPIEGGIESKYYNHLHGPETAEGGNVIKQIFDIKEKKNVNTKEESLTKSEDEISRLLLHDDPNERLTALRLNTVTPQHLQLAALDQDPNVWRAAVDHPLFDDMGLMSSTNNPLQQQSYLLSKPDRAQSHYLDAMWRGSANLPYDQRSKVLDIIATNPLAEVNLIRSLYLDAGTNYQQRSLLVSHQNAPEDLLQYVVESILRLPSNEALELAKQAILHAKMPIEMINSLIKMAVDQPANTFIQDLANTALADKNIDKSIMNYLLTQNKLRPGSHVATLIANALSGPTGSNYNVDQIMHECGPGLWNGAVSLPKDLSEQSMDTLVAYAQKTGNKVLLSKLMDNRAFTGRHLAVLMHTNSIPLEGPK